MTAEGKQLTPEDAIGLLSWLEVNSDGSINNPTWYGGIEIDLEKALNMAKSALKRQEGLESACKQFIWERDIALEQLKELGYELGQKIEIDDGIVSRKAVKEWLKKWTGYLDEDMIIRMQYKTGDIPSVALERELERQKCNSCIHNHTSICGNCRDHDEYEEECGQWIFLDKCSNSGYYCSKCHKKLVKEGWSETVKKIKFCPNCGEKML